MRERISEVLQEAHRRAVASGTLPEGELPAFTVEYPPDESLGDYASNIALVLASSLKMRPRDVAQRILESMPDEPSIERVEVAGPGFLNFFIKDSLWFEELRKACLMGRSYGRCERTGRRVLVEFVSANPTGPLHIGHGRIAAFGDALSRLLEWAGWQVEREYYINDVGTQMEVLGRSVLARYRELLGFEAEFPEDGYRGEYIIDVAKEILKRYGRRLLELPEEEAVGIASKEARDIILNWIREELSLFRVHFDRFFSEASLYENGKVDRVLEELGSRGLLYKEEGAIWFSSSSFGDEKDRVVVRATGAKTYFASDIAYHLDKLSRGYDLLVNIWGADHHGYVKRLQAAIQALGHPKERLKVILVQLVNLLRHGKRVSMSTRAGEFAALRDVIGEVGVDASRFFLLLRRAESPLDFDLEVAKVKGEENPVYYVQYAHARISSIFKKARERGIGLPDPEQVDLSPLSLPEERSLARAVGTFPELVLDASSNFEPHPISTYLISLARSFHSYYNKHRVLGEERGLTEARLLLAWAIKEVIRNGLEILGVEAPEEM